ncbi:MAG: hypothetical protein HQL33_03100 [Alphaproteobacteria bacterium]|nr:hypothetical protein [Alphaproteobacteria bacterium]MBF0128961.1 hypothetical protein [Alphaproteobacteria bacterium]
MAESDLLKVHIDRDGGKDGGPSHAGVLDVPADATVGELLRIVRIKNLLAGTEPERTTWLVDCGGKGCIGVMTRQWREPKLLIAADTRLSDLFAGAEPRLTFRHWGLADPRRVFECLRAGEKLPERYL